ncbi:dihydroneopterin aldolase [bacterium]|nr:dihydroneopterin aldolase [bacterium]
MDQIQIRNLKASLLIGVEDSEWIEKQDIVINIDLMLNLMKPGQSDKLEDALDYHILVENLLEEIKGTEFRLLEALAEKIASFCLAYSKVKKVRVGVEKPGALPNAESVSVKIIRSDE